MVSGVVYFVVVLLMLSIGVFSSFGTRPKKVLVFMVQLLVVKHFLLAVTPGNLYACGCVVVTQHFFLLFDHCVKVITFSLIYIPTYMQIHISKYFTFQVVQSINYFSKFLRDRNRDTDIFIKISKNCASECKRLTFFY